jgi:hypothetical protein
MLRRAGVADGPAGLDAGRLAEAAQQSQTIKMIVLYPAGGTTEFLDRLVADQRMLSGRTSMWPESLPADPLALINRVRSASNQCGESDKRTSEP